MTSIHSHKRPPTDRDIIFFELLAATPDPDFRQSLQPLVQSMLKAALRGKRANIWKQVLDKWDDAQGLDAQHVFDVICEFGFDVVKPK